MGIFSGRTPHKKLPVPLPVIDSVLSRLCIADDELPRGLACLKHKLLFPPPPSQGSDTCANSNFSVRVRDPSSKPTWVQPNSTPVWRRLRDTIPDPEKTMKSLSYLDQIALVCLAAGFYDCQASDCLKYQTELESIVPECHGWPGLRKWALCITSCVSRTVRDMDQAPNLSRVGRPRNYWRYSVEDLVPNFTNYIYACISLTDRENAWDMAERTSEVDNLGGTDENSLIGHPRPTSRTSKPLVSRPSIYTQTFDPSADPPVNVVEVFHLVSWFRNIYRRIQGGLRISKPFWYPHEFLPVASNAIEEASSKIEELRLCQKRVWEVIRNSNYGEIELVPLVRALEGLSPDYLPQFEHKGHGSCTTGFCDDSSKNYTSVTQLHKCPYPHKDCERTPGEMFNQDLLIKALNGNTMTTAWTLDGRSLVAKDRSYLAVSHVWSDGTGTGAWKAGEVNKCLWDFWVDIAGRLECDGVWWDTVSIPQEKAARSKAINNMHQNYTDAKCTVVHDLYLAGMEWKNAESACIALVLSPWFTRGWTALELRLAKKVVVLYRKGDGYTHKYLDKEILAQHPILSSHAHWIANSYVRRVQKAENTPKSTSKIQKAEDTPESISKIQKAEDTPESISKILSALRARYTSWSRDQSIIAALMCGLIVNVEHSEQKITKQILSKFETIERECLLHGLPTMSEPQYSWCPPRFVDITSGTPSVRPWEKVEVCRNGILRGKWEVWRITKTHVDRGIIQPLSMDMSIWGKVQRALQEPEEHVILTCSIFNAQGMLVRLKGYESQLERGLFCKYIGAVNVTPSHIRKDRERIESTIHIGYEQEMVDVKVVDSLFKEPEN